MKLKKGDTILVTTGKDKGKTAKILKSFPQESMILVEGVNLRSKHVKPRRQGEKGQVVKVPSPLNASNVKFLCPKCQKVTRLGYTVTSDKKYRVCKKCQSQV